MKNLVLILLTAILGLAVIAIPPDTEPAQTTIPFPDIPRMKKEQLRDMLGKPDVVILDNRTEEQWKLSEDKIKGAIHENPMTVESWADKYSDKKNATIVTY